MPKHSASDGFYDSVPGIRDGCFKKQEPSERYDCPHNKRQALRKDGCWETFRESAFGLERPVMKHGIMFDPAVLVATKAVSHMSATTIRGRFCGDRVFDTQPQRRRFRLVALVLGLCLCESVAALSLNDIIELSRNGYGEEEITSLIAVTGARFELNVDTLRDLAAAGVSEPVIREMLQAGNRQPDGSLLASLTSEVRTDARGRRDGALADATVDDILKLYRAGLSEATILSFVTRRNECIPLSFDHLLQVAEAGLSQDFVSALDNLSAECRDQERLADSRRDVYIPSNRATRTYRPGIYDDLYYRSILYPYYSYYPYYPYYPYATYPDPREPLQHQEHLIDTQGPQQEVIHHVVSSGDQIDHHDHEVVRDFGRVLVEDLPEHQHVGVSLTEHDALHPDHSASVSTNSRVAERVNDYAYRPPLDTSSRFATKNRSTGRRYVQFGNQSVVSSSNSAIANSSSTRGSGRSRGASPGFSVGNQQTRSGSTGFTVPSSGSRGYSSAGASAGIGHAAPHSAGGAARHQGNARSSGTRR